MVRKINYEDKELYYCEECKLVYLDKNWAKKCEGWCKEDQSCNIVITKHSIKKTVNEL